MTRLIAADIEIIARDLTAHDRRLERTLGADLKTLALEAAAGAAKGLDVPKALSMIRTASVPVNGGLGEIAGFAETVAAITRHMGMDAFVTESSDVAGLAESFERGADLIFLSDDDRFVALCPGRRRIVDNIQATAVGFAAGLERMAGGLVDRQVLILGCGPLGCAAAGILTEMGARIGLCDVDESRSRGLSEQIQSTTDCTPLMVPARCPGLGDWPLIYDATNAAGLIDVDDLAPDALVAAPGMPCGVTARARAILGVRLLHDPLQIGVATMASMGLRLLLDKPEREAF